jgi:hypothetical protein
MSGQSCVSKSGVAVRVAIVVGIMILVSLIAVVDWRRYSRLMADGHLAETTAVITSVRATGVKRRRYEIDYRFIDANGNRRRGRQEIHWQNDLEPSKAIKVFYRPSKPAASAIHPTTLRNDLILTSLAVLFVDGFLFALIVLVFVFRGWDHEKRYERWMRNREHLQEEPRRAPPPHIHHLNKKGER